MGDILLRIASNSYYNVNHPGNVQQDVPRLLSSYCWDCFKGEPQRVSAVSELSQV